MLARAHRMRDGDAFRHTMRRGTKGVAPTLVVHAVTAPEPADSSVGFVVSKAVGSAVDRNRVKRRLRHLVRERVGALDAATWIVVRALPPAAKAPLAALSRDLDRAMARALDGRSR
ncbi:ribonuclease P protein component [Aeromicrobium phragmitis]|uniref:Ribonuclease P protein component n=1 Tax=Aeromicrobium phragmitis TaxID=2478914 RepID=A0A3L8PPH5_9ACTN|nr:ribonuclease P protein component [Aeromicrobium phragmitis]RLV57287.1 ribonuclease P protein component [Aeromicrobium phragmitis]